MSDAELEPLVDALQRRVNHQADRIEELEDTVAELQAVVDPDPGATEYRQLTRDQKVHRIRKRLAGEADESDGFAAMKYNDVKWLFDGHPSAGHCYDLMERAGEMDGFAYDTAMGNGEKRVRVKLADVNDETVVHAVNNASTETPA